MEQYTTELNLFDQNELLLTKEDGSWIEKQSSNAMEQDRSIVQPLYYKCTANIDSSDENLMLAKCWKDPPAIDTSMQFNYSPLTASINTNSLSGHTLEFESLNQSKKLNTHMKAALKSKQEKTDQLKEHQGAIKRIKHPEQWKVNVKKNARLRGEEYIGVGGRIVPAKIMGPPCKCRMRCNQKIDEPARRELHNIFWKMCNWEQRKQYIALSVKESPKQRTRCRGNAKSAHRRQVTFTYSLLIKGDFVTVCKCMFLSTFAVSEKFVRHVMDKKRTSLSGIIGPDLRGRHTPKTKKSETVKDKVREHIKSFPSECSDNSIIKDHSNKRFLDSKLSIAAMHKLYVEKCRKDGVPEEDIVKESYYREMFKTEFNLGFKRAKTKGIEQVQNDSDNAVERVI